MREEKKVKQVLSSIKDIWFNIIKKLVRYDG